MIKDKNNPSIKNTMIKTKFKKKGSNKDQKLKKISSYSKKQIYLGFQKLTRSKNLLYLKKQELCSQIQTKSTDGESDQMLNSDLMSFLI